MPQKPNQIFKYEKVNKRKILISQFKSPLIYVLLLAAILTFTIHEYVDMAVILVTLAINAALGYFQEYRAQNTLFHLKALLKPMAILIRDGKRMEVDAEEVLINDVALISKELSIPADGVLIEGKDVFVNESLLTGEFYPVKKEIGDKLYVGTVIVSGIGKIRVENIGISTKIGEIGKHVLSQKEKITPLQKQIAYLAKRISVLVMFLSVVILLAGVVNKYETIILIETVIAVAVASIPEGLVITMTVILTVGMQKILKQNAIVRRLVAAETLGSVDVICVDKTGTLTEGKLKISSTQFVDQSMALASCLLCNNQIDPLEIAISDYYDQNSSNLLPDFKNQIETSTRLDSIPFANEHKFTATLNTVGDKTYMYIFGAPESVINRCDLPKSEKDVVMNSVRLLGEDSRKVVGFAFKEFNRSKFKLDDVKGLKWNGVIAFEDPIRPSIHATLQTLNQAGIELKMITGDYIHTAISVARNIGLLVDVDEAQMRNLVLSGEDMAKLSPEELKVKVDVCRLFVRINPNQKLMIVEALKENGHVVAMTGDGINDAPALKKSDVGIVVNEASDISKNTADMVLLDSDLKTISFAVQIGRVIFQNIRKVIIYLISGSFSEIALLLTAFVLALPAPLTPLQILWINLIEDTLPALALAYELGDPRIMLLKPRSLKEQILSSKYLKLVGAFIIFSNITLLGYFMLLRSTIPDETLVQTIIFVAFGVESLMFAYSVKELNGSIISRKVFSNWSLNLAVLIGFLLYGLVLTIPLLREVFHVVEIGFEYLVVAVGLGLVNVLLMEVIKKRLNISSQ